MLLDGACLWRVCLGLIPAADFTCALQKEILVHGRLYVSQNFLCFYANIFGWETNLVVRCADVQQVRKEKTAFVVCGLGLLFCSHTSQFPNAIQLVTETGKHLFASFVYRDTAFRSAAPLDHPRTLMAADVSAL